MAACCAWECPGMPSHMQPCSNIPCGQTWLYPCVKSKLAGVCSMNNFLTLSADFWAPTETCTRGCPALATNEMYIVYPEFSCVMSLSSVDCGDCDSTPCIAAAFAAELSVLARSIALPVEALMAMKAPDACDEKGTCRSSPAPPDDSKAARSWAALPTISS
eukprot:5633362-Prymnesium_polylepis.1